MNSMQFQQWSTPFGGFGPGVSPYGSAQSQVGSPSVNGGSPIGEASSYWSQLMQVQQSLFQGWEKFCGCANAGPQHGQVQPVKIHYHKHYHNTQQNPPQSAPLPAPAFSFPPQATAPTRPFPMPPAQSAPSLPSFPSTPSLPSLPSLGAVPGFSGDRVFGASPMRPDRNPQPWEGQSVEDMFNNPFQGQEYLKDALDQVSAIRGVYGVQPPQNQGQKGDLRVIAGDRTDGVKPREVRIDDVNSYEYQKGENSYQENRQETRFKDGTIGREYNITVAWEDGTATQKRVQLREAGQIVYIRSAEGY